MPGAACAPPRPPDEREEHLHKLRSLVALCAVTATLTALAAAPALADPVNSHGKAVTPRSYDIVGVGADTDDTLLDQLSVAYNAAHKTHSKTHPWIYSFDATPPTDPTDLTSTVRTKSGCGKIPRPDGTGAGLTAFETPVKDGKYRCVDFARAASPRTATDPVKGPNGVLYVRLAEDAETYATEPGSNAPASLTPAQLAEIYSCTVPAKGSAPANNWADLGGKNAPIVALLPPPTTGVAKFWLKALGLSSAGGCVDRSDTVTVQQNEGTAKIFSGKYAKDLLVPYSVGKYIAQRYHDAAVGKKPKKTQNEFGRNEHGKLVLGKISKVAPTTGTGSKTKINSKFNALFLRPLYDVVWWAKTKDDIPTRLEPIFASVTISHSPHGWFCGNKSAKKIITDYGFLTTPLCGLGS
jgi:ABC-type phosphate transport system substrate-binding protein